MSTKTNCECSGTTTASLSKKRFAGVAGNVWYIHGQLPTNLLIPAIGELKEICPLQQITVWMFGKLVNQPRLTGATIGYRYSGQTVPSSPMPVELIHVYNWVVLTFFDNDKTGVGALFNYYENGLSYISAHSDDESGLVKGENVVSLSFGQPRTFRIRKKTAGKKTNPIVKDFILADRSVFVMGGADFQRKLTHEIPRVTTKKKVTGPRMNITFRRFKVANSK